MTKDLNFWGAYEKQTIKQQLEAKVKAKRKRTPKKDLEAAVQRECLKWLASQPDLVAYFERRNTGALVVGERYIKFGSPGAADIWVLITRPGSGRVYHIEIECKRRSGGRLSRAQQKFRALCNKIGVVYLVVTSAEDLQIQLYSVVNDSSMFAGTGYMWARFVEKNPT